MLLCYITIFISIVIVNGQYGAYFYPNYPQLQLSPVAFPVGESQAILPNIQYIAPSRPLTARLIPRRLLKPISDVAAATPTPSKNTPEDVPKCKSQKPVKLDYGNCPQLEPKDEDKKMKEEKMKECLKDLELNENSTVDDLDILHQVKVKECILRKQELLNDAGKFQYDKALDKLKEKGIPEDKQKKISEAHVECKLESEARFYNSNDVLAPVDLYQNCLDFHIKMICDVKEFVPNKEPSLPPVRLIKPPYSNNFDILSGLL